jgi:hypothetical protein
MLLSPPAEAAVAAAEEEEAAAAGGASSVSMGTSIGALIAAVEAGTLEYFSDFLAFETFFRSSADMGSLRF